MVIISFVFFTALVGILTWLITHKDDHATSTGYFLGGRSLGGVVIAGSLLLTNLSTEQMVGLNGSAYKDGLSVMAWEVGAVVALVFMALFFLPRYLKSGITTVPQLLEERFDHGTQTITTVIFLFAYAGILLPIILYTGARGLSEMVDLQKLTGINNDFLLIASTAAFVGLVGSVYALWGGLRSVAVSDTLNGVGLLTGGMLIVYFGLTKVSDAGSMLDGLQTVIKTNPDRFNSIGGPTQEVPFGTVFTGVFLLNMFYWTTNQQIIQRTFGASNLREGQKGVILCGALKLLGPLYLVLPGIIAYHLYAGDAGMRNDMAYGRLVRDVLPAPLTGFFIAVMVGAILSSFNSALNSACTLFSIGLYQNVFKRDATEQQVVRSGRVFGIIIAIVAVAVAPMLIGQSSIFAYLQKMNGLYFIPIFAVVIMGLLTKRVPPIAAKVGLIAGLLIIATGYFVPIGTKQVTTQLEKPLAQVEPLLKQQGYALVNPNGVTQADENGVAYVTLSFTQDAAKTIAGDLINDYHFLGLVFIGLLVIMLIIGKLAPTAQAWEHQHTGEVDITPWRFAVPGGIALLIAVATIYALFADFSVLG
ncbi:MAG: solute:sodium symporter family transporter [Phycisphaeraceae bacterium]|nr:solute:sodium symporter family transporter [Phycisphaeraceae bacterium]